MEMQKSKGQKNTTQTKSPKRRKAETNNKRRIKGNIESEIMQKQKEEGSEKKETHTSNGGTAKARRKASRRRKTVSKECSEYH